MTSTKANIISVIESQELHGKKEGPFKPGIRVHCPLKSFAVRKIEFCIGCKFFNGIIKRQMSGEIDINNLKLISRMYGILCSHPINRSLCVTPED